MAGCVRCLNALALLLWPIVVIGEVSIDPQGDQVSLDLNQPDALRVIAFEDRDRFEVLLRLTSPDIDTQLIMELDQDKLLATGGVSWVSLLCPSRSGLGVERRISLLSGAGPARVTDEEGQLLATAEIHRFDAWIRLTMPLSSFAGSVNGDAYALLVGREEVSDCLPNSGASRVSDQAWRFLGGQVTGLIGPGLTLRVDGLEPAPIDSNGSFSFFDPIEEGRSYDVEVLSHPRDPDQFCVVTNGSGTVGQDSIDTVLVACGDPPDAIYEDRFETIE